MTTTVRLPLRLEQMLARYCVEHRRGKSEVIIELLEERFATEAPEVAPLGRDELVSTLDWITRYADRPMDLADASLVITALKTGCVDVWTLNRADFETCRLPGRKRLRLV